MCRRALEASCTELGAKSYKLEDKINELPDSVLSPKIKKLAHKVRLQGNRGAHPPDDGLETIGEREADAMIEFTSMYMQFVYVLQSRMDDFDATSSNSKT